MPSPAWEDTSVFFDTDDFGTLATFTGQDGVARAPVPGIFDDPYTDKALGEYVQDSSDPRFTCEERHAVGLKKHDECRIASMPGRVFLVKNDPQPDGTGTCVVYLVLDRLG